MERAIIGFEQDELGDWRAILVCGHRQHVRHNPPFVDRAWVLTEEGRSRFLGVALACKACDEGEPVNDAPVSAARLEAIYAQFHADLRCFVLSRGADPGAAEDILWRAGQEIQSRADDLGESEGLATWLDAIIRDAITAYYRAMPPGVERSESAALVRTDEDGDVTALGSAVRGLLDCLPGEYRQALILTDYHGLSPGDIAGRLDIAPAAAEARIRRGRAMLREALLDWGQFLSRPF